MNRSERRRKEREEIKKIRKAQKEGRIPEGYSELDKNSVSGQVAYMVQCSKCNNIHKAVEMLSPTEEGALVCPMTLEFVSRSTIHCHCCDGEHIRPEMIEDETGSLICPVTKEIFVKRDKPWDGTYGGEQEAAK